MLRYWRLCQALARAWSEWAASQEGTLSCRINVLLNGVDVAVGSQINRIWPNNNVWK
jgi:hypothetical protein